MRQRVRQGVDARLHAAADEVRHHGRAAVIRHVHHLDASHQLEKLPGHVTDGPGAERSGVDLAGVGFGVGDKLGDGLDRHGWVHLHDERQFDERGDRREVAQEVERQRRMEARVDRVRGGHE